MSKAALRRPQLLPALTRPRIGADRFRALADRLKKPGVSPTPAHAPVQAAPSVMVPDIQVIPTPPPAPVHTDQEPGAVESEQVAAPALDFEAVFTPEPVAESAPVAAFEAVFAPEPEAATGPDFTELFKAQAPARPEPEPEPVVLPELQLEPEPEPEPEPEIRYEPDPEPVFTPSTATNRFRVLPTRMWWSRSRRRRPSRRLPAFSPPRPSRSRLRSCCLKSCRPRRHHHRR